MTFSYRSLLLAVVITTCLASCDKNDTSPNPTPTVIDSPYIQRYVTLDTTYASPRDSLFTSFFNYDGQKRLTSMTQRAFDQLSNAVAWNATEAWQYNGTDTVPFKIVRKETYLFPQVLDDTTYFTYDANNMIVKDSMLRSVNGVRYDRIRMTYTAIGNDKYIIIRTIFNINNGTVFSRDSIRSLRTYTNGNLVTSYDSLFHLPAGNLFEVYKMTYNYDNKPNPWRRISLHYPTFIANYHTSAFSFHPNNVLSVNNPTSFTMSQLSTGTNVTGETKYIYNSGGYPALIRSGNAAGTAPKWKDFQFYTKL